MSDKAKSEVHIGSEQERGKSAPPMLPNEDARQYTARLYEMGYITFSPHCRCGDQGCTACTI